MKKLSFTATRLLLTLWFIGFVFIEPTFACECRRHNEFRREFVRAGAVFVGEVMAVDASQPDAVVTFRVEKMWKGVKAARVEVRTDSRGKACGYPFRRGERYLVYAFDGGLLRTSICTRTSEINTAAADLKMLARKKAL